MTGMHPCKMCCQHSTLYLKTMLTVEVLMNIISTNFFHFYGKQKYGGAIFSIQILGKESSFISNVHLIQSQNSNCLRAVLHGWSG